MYVKIEILIATSDLDTFALQLANKINPFMCVSIIRHHNSRRPLFGDVL